MANISRLNDIRALDKVSSTLCALLIHRAKSRYSLEIQGHKPVLLSFNLSYLLRLYRKFLLWWKYIFCTVQNIYFVFCTSFTSLILFSFVVPTAHSIQRTNDGCVPFLWVNLCTSLSFLWWFVIFGHITVCVFLGTSRCFFFVFWGHRSVFFFWAHRCVFEHIIFFSSTSLFFCLFFGTSFCVFRAHHCAFFLGTSLCFKDQSCLECHLLGSVKILRSIW